MQHELVFRARRLTLFRRDHGGFVFQFYNLIPSLTARENVAVVTEISRAQMYPEEALALVGLGARRRRLSRRGAFRHRGGDDVLQIPSGALFRHDGGWVVFVADGGKARLQAIGTGQRNGLWVEVLSGLQAGERVIVHPDDKVTAGRRMKSR